MRRGKREGEVRLFVQSHGVIMPRVRSVKAARYSTMHVVGGWDGWVQ